MSAIDDVIEYVQTYGYKEEAMTARKAADQLAALRAELDKQTKAVDEARFILSQIDYWADSDWELLANAWLTAHPANNAGQDPEGKEE